MRTKTFSTLFLAVFFLYSGTLYALAPVESLVLGNFSEDYSENKTDPLNYVYSRDLTLKSASASYKKELASYRGFYEEGKNLTNYCKGRREIRYASEWEKVQTKRSVMSLIQYIGLDLSARALPQYAKALEFTREEYANMVEGLVGNYCSTNLSVISKKELLNNLFLKFDKENNFKLPTIDGNPYFPDNIDSYLPSKKALEQEMLYTVKLFQSLCSWNGNPNTPGLLAPILKHSALMSFFGRQLSGQSIGWKEVDNSLFLKEDNQTVKVWCENLVCRKTTHREFDNKFYYSIGGTSIAEDMKRLYCEDFRSSDFRPNDYDPKIAKMMNSMTFEEENFINSQFIALITGIPDFLLRAEKFNAGEDLFRSSVDYTWTKWAKNVTENFTDDLYFEEPLTLELVDRKQYFNFRNGKLKVAFDVNLGEFDRITQRAGKVKIKFNIPVPNSLLLYYRNFMKNSDYRDTDERNRIKNRLKMHLIKPVQEAREKFLIPPWKGELEGIIVYELSSQILDIPEKLLTFEEPGMHLIEIEVNYGVFALKYLNHQLNVQKSQTKSSDTLNKSPQK